MGLKDEWIKKIEQKGSRKVLIVRRLVAKTDAAEKLKTGDLLVAINGDTVTHFKEMEELSQKSEQVT